MKRKVQRLPATSPTVKFTAVIQTDGGSTGLTNGRSPEHTMMESCVSDGNSEKASEARLRECGNGDR